MKYLHTDYNSFISRMLILNLLLLVFAVMASQASAQSNELSTEQFLAVKNNLQAAVDSLDKAGVIKAKYALQPYSKNSDKQLQKLAYYYMGYADYRLNTLFQDISEDQKEQFLDESVKLLEKSVALNANFADAQALLGSAYGMKAAGFFSGMKYGPKSDNALERAMKNEPNNPRAHMLNSIGKLYKPSMFGGSTEGAIKGFEKAASLFKEYEPKNKLMPDWGHAEVYAWLGQGYVQNEQYQEAKKAYQQALEIDPNYGWVKYKLLPDLKKKSE